VADSEEEEGIENRFGSSGAIAANGPERLELTFRYHEWFVEGYACAQRLDPPKLPERIDEIVMVSVGGGPVSSLERQIVEETTGLLKQLAGQPIGANLFPGHSDRFCDPIHGAGPRPQSGSERSLGPVPQSLHRVTAAC
jgi:hypothetical protein